MKKYLIRFELLPNTCALCKLGASWQSKPLVFHLDHIDGNPTNNRLENLRILCPNCHSQTPTYCGKNATHRKKRKPKATAFCKTCNKQLSASWGIQCISCYGANRKRAYKIDWPEDKKFIHLISTRNSMEELAGQLGVSSNAIRKHCRKLDIDWHNVKI